MPPHLVLGAVLLALACTTVTIAGARHDDMTDAGSSKLQGAIIGQMRLFLKSPHPPSLH